MASIHNNSFNGQVVQVARGNLLKRLAAKPLAWGELFLHTEGKTNIGPGSVTTHVHDVVSNADLQTIFTGDMFAGCNDSENVYYLGSGGELKWGGLINAANFTALKNQIKPFPNHIFMYNGDSELYDSSTIVSPTLRQNVTGETQPAELTKTHVASSSNEFAQKINPGDLVFYNTALDQVIVLHLSRSTDALTKINVNNLVSNSMRSLLTEAVLGGNIDPADYNLENVPSTLKTFLDGPARHYQYLADNQGWSKATLCENASTNTEYGLTFNADYSVLTRGRIYIPENIKDGEIYYVGFGLGYPTASSTSIGHGEYQIYSDLEGTSIATSRLIDPNDDVIHEGDFIIALPQNDGSTKLAIVHLFDKIFDRFKFHVQNFNRADAYATDIWEDGISGSYVGDAEFNNTHDQLEDFIDRLFTTKVDIDPTTHKIIASQLPDFLLGAPKYMGHLEKNTTYWNALPETTTAEEFAAALLSNWQNLDDSEDDTGNTNPDNENDSADVNEKLKSGCYWIYTGDTVDVSKFTEIFHFTDADKDDSLSGEDAEIAALIAQLEAARTALVDNQTLSGKYQQIIDLCTQYANPATTDDTKTNILVELNALRVATSLSNSEVVQDTDVSNLATAATTAKATTDADITTGQTTIAGLEADIEDAKAQNFAQHLLNKGDWIIYNGDPLIQKFEIIDQTTSFIGILVNSTKVTGVAEFKNSPKELNVGRAWKTANDGRSAKNAKELSQDVSITATNNSITFQNENKVFAAGADLLDGSFLPRISGTRTDTGNVTLVNSRLKIIDDTDVNATHKFDTGLQVSYPTGYLDNKDIVTSATLHWHKNAADLIVEGDLNNPTDIYSVNDLYRSIILSGTLPTNNAGLTVTTRKLAITDNVTGKVAKSGLNFDWVMFMGNDPNTGVGNYTSYYHFLIDHEENPNIYLPSYSGTLVTDTYVNTGFTVVKAMINDAYEKAVTMSTHGHVDWLQTIRLTNEVVPGTTNEYRKEVYDSNFLQVVDTDKVILKLFYDRETPPTETTGQNHVHTPRSENDYAAQISSYQDLADAAAAPVFANTDYQLGAGIDETGTATAVLNPSVADSSNDAKPEQVLPNHSGVLLNNNSVIDGGVWL